MTAPRIAVSTWSLRRALGLTYPNSPADDAQGRRQETYGSGALALLDLPAALARHGYDRLELVHFQMPGRDPGFLAELKAALSASAIRLQSLLIDDGDPATPTDRERDIAWIGRWIEAAAALGADQVRVTAGKQPPSREALDRCVEGFRQVLAIARANAMPVVTENWQALMDGPAAVRHLLDAFHGEVGFIADFANWKGAGKYAALAEVMSYANETHAAAAHGTDGSIDTEDFGHCLDLVKGARRDIPHTLIYSGPDADEWTGLARQRGFLEARLAA